MSKTLTAAQIAAAWRESGAVSATPPDWALRFARFIEREALATQQPEPRDEVTVPDRERRHWNPVYNTDPVQRACAELPDGYEIEILLERDAGTVDVCGPDGSRLDADFDEDTFDWKIHAAIDAAIDAARTGASHE
ncbi:hypothetical protein ABXK61_16285 [Burkholderia sola]|uniref:hypothetical protein n=1 Tax=Burkholderia TaxID=32008 RepID=UPI001AE55427|nr:hypothetical protein [Burkholderia sp. AcTa6-5]MBP0714864.1 hypothetical protein [Burkholderia sp. AcTa6-5]